MFQLLLYEISWNNRTPPLIIIILATAIVVLTLSCCVIGPAAAAPAGKGVPQPRKRKRRPEKGNLDSVINLVVPKESRASTAPSWGAFVAGARAANGPTTAPLTRGSSRSVSAASLEGMTFSSSMKHEEDERPHKDTEGPILSSTPLRPLLVKKAAMNCGLLDKDTALPLLQVRQAGTHTHLAHLNAESPYATAITIRDPTNDWLQGRVGQIFFAYDPCGCITGINNQYLPTNRKDRRAVMLQLSMTLNQMLLADLVHELKDSPKMSIEDRVWLQVYHQDMYRKPLRPVITWELPSRRIEEEPPLPSQILAPPPSISTPALAEDEELISPDEDEPPQLVYPSSAQSGRLPEPPFQPLQPGDEHYDSWSTWLSAMYLTTSEVEQRPELVRLWKEYLERALEKRQLRPTYLATAPGHQEGNILCTHLVSGVKRHPCSRDLPGRRPDPGNCLVN